MIVWRDPSRSSRSKSGGRARRHRRVRRRPPRAPGRAPARARPRTRAADSRSTVLTFDRHPAEVVRTGFGAEAAHDARPEARAARGDGGRPVPRARVRRGPQQGARGRFVARCSRACSGRGRGGGRRLPFRLPAPRRRRSPAAHGRRARAARRD